MIFWEGKLVITHNYRRSHKIGALHASERAVSERHTDNWKERALIRPQAAAASIKTSSFKS